MHRTVVGVDIGNSTTEASLARIGPDGTVDLARDPDTADLLARSQAGSLMSRIFFRPLRAI